MMDWMKSNGPEYEHIPKEETLRSYDREDWSHWNDWIEGVDYF